jgi:DNA-binding NarL/FixJ family response regulator
MPPKSFHLTKKPANESDGVFAERWSVLYWVTQGKTNPEIAIIFSLSPGTVNKHMEHILAKLDVPNRMAAAAVTADFVRMR